MRSPARRAPNAISEAGRLVVGSATRSIVSVDGSILIRRASPEVFAYVSDYTRDPTWRTGVSEMLHDPPGQIHLGARTHERLTFAGLRMTNVAQIVEFEPGRTTAFRTIGGSLVASGYRLVETAADGAHVTYAAEVELHGPIAIAAPLLEWYLGRTVRRDLERLKHILEAAP